VLGQKLKQDEKPPPEAELRDLSAERIRAAEGRPLQILGLEPGAGSKSIRRAYHALALLHHPDKGGDDAVFKAIADAYKHLTESQDESGGWRDLEKVNLPPWTAHTEAGTKGVSVVVFDAFGTPPWESRRLYTAAWQEGVVKCWNISPPYSNRQPKLAGELHVGGFINDVAALSPFGIITAQSAGMKPQPGESLRCWNLKSTPFRPAKRAQANAIGDDGAGATKAVTGGGGSSDATAASAAGRGGQLATVTAPEDAEETLAKNDEFSALEEQGYLDKSQMVFLHYRGVRSMSLWPRPGVVRGVMPHHIGTVSKDVIAVSKVSIDGCGLEPAEWKQSDPHDMTDVNVMKHQTANLLWTGDNNGIVKCWDINSSGKGIVQSFSTGATGWISGMELWDGPGVLCVSHSSGMVFMDARAGKVVQDMRKKEAVGKIVTAGPNHSTLFAGVGSELMQYDTRCFAADLDYKKMAVGMWTLSAPITALTCTDSYKGHILVAAGCMNGKVAVLDTT